MSARSEEFTLSQFKNELNGILRSIPGASPHLKFIDANYLEGKEIPHLRLEQEFDLSSAARWEAFIRDLKRCGIDAQLSRNLNTNQLRIIIKKNPGEAHFAQNREAIAQIFAQHLQAPVSPSSSAQTSTPSMSLAQAMASSTPSSAMSSAQASASSVPPSGPVETSFSSAVLASHQALVGSLRATSTPALHSAAQQGNLGVVKRILEEGKEKLRVQIDAARFPFRYAKGAPKDTIFHTAVRNGDYRQLFSLLAYPRSDEDRTLVNEKNLFGETPLQLAIKTMDFNAAEIFYQCIKMQKEGEGRVQEVISATDDEYRWLEAMHQFWHIIHQKDQNGNLPLHLAAEHGRVEVVNYLLEPQGKPLIDNGVIQNNDGNTPLHLAVRNGHIGIAKKLIASMILVVNARNKDGDTPLHLAVRHGHVEIVEYLKNAKVLVIKRIRDNPERFAGNVEMAIRQAELAGNKDRAEDLRLARNRNDLEKLIELLGYTIDVNIKNNEGDTPLSLALKSGNREMIAHLINLGANLEEKDENGDTFLHRAVMDADMEMVDRLIDVRADREAKNENGDTPLHLAVMTNNRKMVEKLNFRGSKVNAQNLKGNTPLHSAIELKNCDMVRTLRGIGADLNLLNADGETPLHMAIRNRANDIAKFLIKHADLTIVNSDGLTPLAVAVKAQNLEMFHFLIKEIKADINVKDVHGNTLLALAIKTGK